MAKSSKRALLLSALAIVLCIAMLIGTTYAWFTDTASTAVNKIQSGSLGMKVEYSKDMNEWAEIDPETAVFDKETIWEPGHTEVVYFRVTNTGNLALRYDLETFVNSYGNGKNAEGKTFSLDKYLMFGSADTESAYDTREKAIAAVSGNERLIGTKNISVKKNVTVLPGESSVVSALVLYMPTTVGNEANDANPNDSYIPYIEVGVIVNATQATYEKDSFDDQYDKNAPTRFSPVAYSSGTHTISESIHADGRWGAVQANGGNITVEADVHATARDNMAVAVWASAAWNSKANVTINSGSFTQDKPGNDSHYDLIYASGGGKITINGGTFKAATPEWTLNCKDGSGSTITVKGGTFYKFDPSNANVGAGEIIVPEGYEVVRNGDWYTVVAK